jgi:hypothetical protein
VEVEVEVEADAAAEDGDENYRRFTRDVNYSGEGS